MRESRPPWGEGRLAAHRGAAVILLAALGACATEAPAVAPAEPLPPLSGEVHFVRDHAGATSTWRLDLATGATSELGPGFPAAPDPLGQVVLLVASEETAEGHRERLCTVSLPPAGGEFVCAALAPAAEFVRNPAWSPDGSFVVFESSAASFRDLWRAPRGGGEPTRLTDAPHGSFDPAVSPDGATLAFVSSREGDLELYTQPIAGGEAARRTLAAGDDRAPAWRPDGARLAWLATRGERVSVVTALPDGSDVAELSPETDGAIAFSWSPDGRRLAVLRSASIGAELVVVDAVRGLRLAGAPAVAANAPPAWTPAGDAVLFAAPVEGASRIAALRTEGGAVQVLTSGPGADWLPRAAFVRGAGAPP